MENSNQETLAPYKRKSGDFPKINYPSGCGEIQVTKKRGWIGIHTEQRR